MTQKLFTRIRSILLTTVMLLVAVSLSACDSDANDDEPEPDIVEIAAASADFETLVTAVQAADLVSTLQGSGPFTVFAPTDDAFAKLPAGTLDNLLQPENKAQLASILTYHVVPGRVTAEDVVTLQSATTVQGESIAIRVEGGTVFVNDAQVLTTDIEAENGVIHVIDSVLLPPTE